MGLESIYPHMFASLYKNNIQKVTPLKMDS
jgi:hypothetical protein